MVSEGGTSCDTMSEISDVVLNPETSQRISEHLKSIGKNHEYAQSANPRIGMFRSGSDYANQRDHGHSRILFRDWTSNNSYNSGNVHNIISKPETRYAVDGMNPITIDDLRNNAVAIKKFNA